MNYKLKDMQNKILELAKQLKQAELDYQLYLATGESTDDEPVSCFSSLKVNDKVIATKHGNLLACPVCGCNTLTYNGVTLVCDCEQWKVSDEELSDIVITTIL